MSLRGNEYWGIRTMSPDINIWAYEYHYLEVIYGEKPDFLNYDIFEHEEEYKQILINASEHMKRNAKH